jgi:hypothetical protein
MIVSPIIREYPKCNEGMAAVDKIPVSTRREELKSAI